jgi:hypothetical protein
MALSGQRRPNLGKIQDIMQSPVPAYNGPGMINPNVPMTDYWGGVTGVGNPSQYTSGIDMVRGGGHYAQGIPLVQDGAFYGRGIDMVQGGQSYFGGAFLPGQGKQYFNDKTIDLVDARSNSVGLEAQAGRTLSRMGGAMGADLSAQGLSGGPMANMMRQSLTAEVGGNLAKDIESFNFAREEARQGGTLAKQQGVLAGDVARSQADLGKRNLQLSGDTARMQGQVARNQLILSGDTARQQGAISRNQLALSGDTARMQGQVARNQLGLQAAGINSNVSLAQAQGRASDQQFGLGQSLAYNTLNSNNYWANDNSMLQREQLIQGAIPSAGVMGGGGGTLGRMEGPQPHDTGLGVWGKG